MNVIGILFLAAGAYLLLKAKNLSQYLKGTLAGESPDLSSLVSPTHGMTIDQLVDYYENKSVTDLTDEDRQTLLAHLANIIQSQPPVGYFGKMLIPVESVAPGVWKWIPDSGCDGGGCLFIRQEASERSKLSGFLDPQMWYSKNPNIRLMKKNAKGQKKYGFFDKHAGDIKRIGGQIIGLGTKL